MGSMKKRIVSICLASLILSLGTARAEASEPLQVLLIEGQNNHRNWPETSQFMKSFLEKTGKFEVTLTRTPPSDGRKQNYGASQPEVPEMAEALQAQWDKWRPEFSSYDLVLSNYNGVLWPEEVQLGFMEYLQNGGGFVVVHAANNAFSQWEEYQRMIGVGGWYGRTTEQHGPKILWENDQLVLDHSSGKCGAHGKRQPAVVDIRNLDHPITKGFPSSWLHPNDEVYFNMCGPAEGLTVLASAYSDPNTGGSGKDHPIVLTTDYEKGRVFHIMLGHSNEAFAGAGFQHLLVRGSEWAATGTVTFPAPDASDFSSEAIVTKAP